MRIILASKSPRRDEILNLASIKHEIIVSDADESLPEGILPTDAVKLLSEIKARAVVNTAFNGKLPPNTVILGADTVVEWNGEIFGKPKDNDDARRMLTSLSGCDHYVHTGFTLISEDKTVTESVTTKVTMRDIREDELEYYINSGEPKDKAGAYAIQGFAGLFVSSFDGDYYNVVGLPLCRVWEALRELGYRLDK